MLLSVPWRHLHWGASPSGMQAVPKQWHPTDAATLLLPSPVLQQPCGTPQSIFGHPYPGRHNLPVSPSPFFPSGDWHGLTLGPCPVSPQGDSPGTAAPSGRGHASPSPGQLSGRAASIRRKLQTSGEWWGTVVPLCTPSAWPGSLHQRRLLPPALSQPDTGRQSLCGGAS